jgi:glycosyltransferase involved in cell wall biosynthesis
MGWRPLDLATISHERLKTYILRKYEELLAIFGFSWQVSNDQLLNSLLQDHPRIKRIKKIPNFVDSNIWKFSGNSRPKCARDYVHIGYYGRFEPEKNLLALIEAVIELPSIKLTLIGSGSLKPQIAAASAGYSRRVSVKKQMPPSLLVREAKNWDFAILPSTSEGNPKFLLEMFSLGVPVIATSNLNTQDLFGYGENFVKIDVATVQGIKDALTRAIALSNEELVVLITNAHNKVLKENSIENIYKSEISYYFDQHYHE